MFTLWQLSGGSLFKAASHHQVTIDQALYNGRCTTSETQLRTSGRIRQLAKTLPDPERAGGKHGFRQTFSFA